jgi:hypothetical protein
MLFCFLLGRLVGRGFSETKMVLVGKGDGEGFGLRQQGHLFLVGSLVRYSVSKGGC